MSADLEKELRVRAIQTSLMVVPSIGQLSLPRHLCPSPPTRAGQEHSTLAALWNHLENLKNTDSSAPAHSESLSGTWEEASVIPLRVLVVGGTQLHTSTQHDVLAISPPVCAPGSRPLAATGVLTRTLLLVLGKGDGVRWPTHLPLIVASRDQALALIILCKANTSPETLLPFSYEALRKSII